MTISPKLFSGVAGAAPAILLSLAALLSVFHAVASGVDSKSKEIKYEWQTLSSSNFSSQIRLHSHILLLVTVPWCGESRSLMREILEELSKEKHKYNSLKLMLVYGNREKALANSLGAAEGTTILCYQHAVSYKYQGILRVQNILSSAHYLFSLAREELPLKRLENSEDVQMFLRSTDMSVLLMDTCRWTSKLLEQHNGDIFSSELNKHTNRTLASGRPKYSQMDIKDEVKNCAIEDGCGESPWFGEFSADNGTSSTSEEVLPTSETSCSFEEYNKFKYFFSKFIAAARNAYLPPQRRRYGVVTDRLLLSSLGIDVSDEWSLIISNAGCPSCITKVKEENHLLDALEMSDLPVMELLDEGNDIGLDLPMDKPSILLFIDRISDSIQTREKSQEALLAFKRLALQYWKLHHIDGRDSGPRKRSVLKDKGSAGTNRDHKLVISSASHKIKLKDKVSVVIINDGKRVTLDSEASDLQSSSLHEILSSLLRQKKNSKLSSLAKEAGFQLLSDDINIKLKDVLSSHMEIEDQNSARQLVEVADLTVVDMNKDYVEIASPMTEEDQSEPTNNVCSFENDDDKASIEISSRISGLMDRSQSFNNLEVDPKTRASVGADLEDLQHQIYGFNGSFSFCDGNYKLLRSLTNQSEVPRIVIIDPSSQQHYVFSEEAFLNHSSLSTLIHRFLNGSLIPYQRSGVLQKSVEMPHPPFVNLDFHEKDSIPSVTTETFTDYVLGSGQSTVFNSSDAWHKDVVVLFSSSWCGFCQRMELIVREVYRALKGYVNTVKSDSKDGLKDVISKLPTIYSIDCTLNDCEWILNSVGQRKVYPSLLLFPAKNKNAIPYHGSMMVTDVIRFIANNGISSQQLVRQKGTLWTEVTENDNHGDIFGDAFTRGDSKESSDKKINHDEATSKEMKLQKQVMFQQNDKPAPWNLGVGSFLVATGTLYGVNPFSESWILLVSATEGIGFRGLIVNKPLSWGYVHGFEDVEMLKEAPVSFGGPIIQNGMSLVSLTRSSLNEQYPQVLPGVYFLDQLATLNKIEEINAGNQSAMDYWFFWGYSGWSWNQLFSEIDEGAWTPQNGRTEDLQWP